MEERTKTISKNFYDDEILFKDENGDIHLKPGVKRKHYGDSIDPDQLETHINYVELKISKISTEIKESRNWDE